MLPLRKSAALALLALTLAACSKPADAPNPSPKPTKNEQPAPPATNNPPATTPETVDVQVRQTIQTYFDALNAGDESKINALWSPTSSSGRLLPVKGVSNWHLQSTEMLSSDENNAYVQVNFDSKVEVGNPSGFNDGKNARFFRLTKESSGWKIQSIQTSP